MLALDKSARPVFGHTLSFLKFRPHINKVKIAVCAYNISDAQWEEASHFVV